MTGRSKLTIWTLIVTAFPVAIEAQDRVEPNGIMSGLAQLHDAYKSYIMATADRVPEELYTFRPTEDVRTLGAMLAHIADNNYFFCSSGAREQNPHVQRFQRTWSTKADIIAALEESFAYCDDIYARTSDADGVQQTAFQGAEYPAGSVLAANTAHNANHYGSLVTYMRMNGIVPPSTAGH